MNQNGSYLRRNDKFFDSCSCGNCRQDPCRGFPAWLYSSGIPIPEPTKKYFVRVGVESRTNSIRDKFISTRTLRAKSSFAPTRGYFFVVAQFIGRIFKPARSFDWLKTVSVSNRKSSNYKIITVETDLWVCPQDRFKNLSLHYLLLFHRIGICPISYRTTIIFYKLNKYNT